MAKKDSRPGLQPIAGRSSRAEPYEQLKEAILSGDLEPGTPLVESSLASMFDVSRTPIREALMRLEQDGLLARDKSGLVVRERTPGEILDIYDTRILLESAAARTAAERRTSHDIMLMTQLLRAWDQVDRTDARAMVRLNRDFHRAVWRASHNESLVDLLQRLDLHVARFPATTLSAPGRWEEAGAEHTRLVAAIDQREADRAADIATRHFEAARGIRLQLWSEDAQV